MPTGYTAMIEEDGVTDARAYIEKCSKAFGIAIHQREDDFNKPLEYPKKNTYSHEALRKAVDEMAKLNDRSQEDIDWYYKLYKTDARSRNAKYKRDHDRKQESYQTVLDKLALWHPADEISQNIKKFAIEQIYMCYRPDDEAYQTAIEEDAKKWHAAEVSRAQRNIDYYTQQVEEDDARYLEQVRNIDTVRKEFLKVPR